MFIKNSFKPEKIEFLPTVVTQLKYSTLPPLELGVVSNPLRSSSHSDGNGYLQAGSFAETATTSLNNVSNTKSVQQNYSLRSVYKYDIGLFFNKIGTMSDDENDEGF